MRRYAGVLLLAAMFLLTLLVAPALGRPLLRRPLFRPPVPVAPAVRYVKLCDLKLPDGKVVPVWGTVRTCWRGPIYQTDPNVTAMLSLVLANQQALMTQLNAIHQRLAATPAAPQPILVIQQPAAPAPCPGSLVPPAPPAPIPLPAPVTPVIPATPVAPAVPGGLMVVPAAPPAVAPIAPGVVTPAAPGTVVPAAPATVVPIPPAATTGTAVRGMVRFTYYYVSFAPPRRK